MNATELPPCLRPYAAAIDAVADERAAGDGYWVYLVWGLCDEEGAHYIHGSSPQSCARQMPHIMQCIATDCCPRIEASLNPRIKSRIK